MEGNREKEKGDEVRAYERRRDLLKYEVEELKKVKEKEEKAFMASKDKMQRETAQLRDQAKRSMVEFRNWSELQRDVLREKGEKELEEIRKKLEVEAKDLDDKRLEQLKLRDSQVKYDTEFANWQKATKDRREEFEAEHEKWKRGADAKLSDQKKEYERAARKNDEARKVLEEMTGRMKASTQMTEAEERKRESKEQMWRVEGNWGGDRWGDERAVGGWGSQREGQDSLREVRPFERDGTRGREPAPRPES